MRSTRIAVFTAMSAVAVGLPFAAAAPMQGASMNDVNYPLKGAWHVVIDPGAPGGGDQFVSTLAFGAAKEVVEATSRDARASTGLGAWTRTGPSEYRITFEKYRFDATGAYLGKAIIRETITVTSPTSYRGSAMTQMVDAAGATVAQFPSNTVGSRLAP